MWLVLAGACAPAASSPPAATPTPTAVGAASGAPTSAEIGPEGGTLSVPDAGVALQVAAGAVASKTMFTLQPLVNEAPGAVGAAWRVSASGAAPATGSVQLVFDLPDAVLAGAPASSLLAARQRSDGLWKVEPSVLDEPARTLAARPSSLGDVSLVRGFNLLPASASVRLGSGIALRVASCYGSAPDVQGSDGALAQLGFSCDDDSVELAPLLPTVRRWLVNGAQGGDGTAGTVASTTQGRAHYTAPGSKPANNPVAVSAEFDTQGGARVTLVSNLKVVGAIDQYSGTVAFQHTAVGKAQLSGTLPITLDLVEHREGDVDRYTGTASASYALQPELSPWSCQSTDVTGAQATAELKVYPSGDSIRGLGDPLRSRLTLEITVDQLGSAQCTQGSTTTEIPLGPGPIASTGCVAAADPVYSDAAQLGGSGSFACQGVEQDALSWTLSGREAP
jgi:hypothetical protein